MLIAVVAKTDPVTADKFIDFVKQKNYFDPGTTDTRDSSQRQRIQDATG
jgi:hypothetical protein